MKIELAGLLLVGIALASAAVPEAPTLAGATGADASWLKEANTVEGAELSASELAVLRAQRDDVYGYAREMVDDHARSDREIAEIASSLGLGLAKLPADPEFESTSAPRFDAAYLRNQVKSHEQAAELFERGARSANPRIQTFAARRLPTIRRHLAEARRLASTPR